jgi:co-chaperonin GroES (HSP10)
MKPYPYYVIVKMKKFFNDEVGGLKINTTFRPQWYVKQEAEVVSVPDNPITAPIYWRYDGSPAPRAEQPTRTEPVYNLYHHQGEPVFGEQFDVDIKPGDTVFFHFNSIYYPGTNQDVRVSYIHTDEDGYEYHRVKLSSIYLRIRDGKVKMLFGRVSVKPLPEEMQEVEVEGSKTLAVVKNGLVMSTKEQLKYLEGIVDHIGDFAGPEKREGVVSGDRILYLPNSEFENVLEGDRAYIMLYTWIVAKWSGEDYSPLGRYVKLKKLEENPDGLRSVPGSVVRIMHGIVEEVGPDCDESVEVGSTVILNSISPHFAHYEDNTIFVMDMDIHFVVSDDLQEKL